MGVTPVWQARGRTPARRRKQKAEESGQTAEFQLAADYTFIVGHWRLFGHAHDRHRYVGNCLRNDCFGPYFTHAQSCDVTRVQSATEWTAWVHASHMSKAMM